MEKPLLLEVKYRMKPGMRTEFLQQAAQLGLVEFFRKEEGSRRYEYVLPAEEDELLLFEAWDSADQQKRHTETEPFRQLMELKARCVEKTELRTTEGETE